MIRKSHWIPKRGTGHKKHGTLAQVKSEILGFRNHVGFLVPHPMGDLEINISLQSKSPGFPKETQMAKKVGNFVVT